VRHRQGAAAEGDGGGEVGDDGGGGAAAFELPPVPFGVFLAPAAMIALLAGDRLIAWYFARILA
jgi:hypothetical protein